MRYRFPLFLCLAISALAALPAAAQSPVVTVNGPTAVTVSRNCYTVTWEAVASGGQTPYSYSWTLDGSPIGTNSPSVTKQYCSTSGTCSVFSDTIQVLLTDFNGREDTDSLTITVTLRGCNASGTSCAC
jgi:hypothetical protein